MAVWDTWLKAFPACRLTVVPLAVMGADITNSHPQNDSVFHNFRTIIAEDTVHDAA